MPTEDQLWEAWPSEARSIGLEGSATYQCVVGVDGRARDCKLTSVDPGGFGQAAAPFLAQMRFKPGMRDGQPAPISDNLTFRFKCNGRCRPFDAKSLERPLILEARWVKAPSMTQMADAYPASAAARNVEGFATLLCVVKAQGALGGCQVTEERPLREGFADAARKLIPLFQGPALIDGKSTVGDTVRVPVHFLLDGSGHLSMKRGTPELIGAPTQKALLEAFPKKALTAGVREARIVLSCSVMDSGQVHDCTVANETPPNLDFGPAALGLADSFQLSIWGHDGLPTTGGITRIPIVFKIDEMTDAEAKAVANSPPPTIITHPQWIRKPSAEDLDSHYPVRAMRLNVTGQVQLACVVKPDGTVQDCSVVSETPEKYGFGAAALAMAHLFEMKPTTIDGAPVGGARVQIPIGFKLD